MQIVAYVYKNETTWQSQRILKQDISNTESQSLCLQVNMYLKYLSSSYFFKMCIENLNKNNITEF